MSGLLELREITRTFTVPNSEPLHILTGINLSVSPGEYVAVVGRSGAGKSTLLNILGLIDKPASGHYTLSGTDTSRLGESHHTHLRGQTFGFILQSSSLIPGLTITRNVTAPPLYDIGRVFWAHSTWAAELLGAVGLGDKVGSPTPRLPGGGQQRVAIARALSYRLSAILAGKPIGALNVDTGNSVVTLPERQYAEDGATLIIITHDLAVASRAHTQHRPDHGVLTPISVMRHKVGSLGEFGEAVTAPPASPYLFMPTSQEGTS